MMVEGLEPLDLFISTCSLDGFRVAARVAVPGDRLGGHTDCKQVSARRATTCFVGVRGAVWEGNPAKAFPG